MRGLRIVILVFVAMGLNPWQRVEAQTAEQEKHPKFPELMQHFQAYQEANKKSDYETALREAEKALKLGLEIAGVNDPLVAALYNNLGEAWREKGEYGKAITYFEKALQISLKTLGAEHPDIAALYNNLGRALTRTAEYDKAIVYYEKSLKIRITALGEKHLDVGQSYNNLGTAWRIKGEYDKAIAYYEKALKIVLKILSDRHPDVATLYNNLGGAWDNKGEYDKAIFYYEKALKIRLAGLGDVHPDVGESYNNLGSAWDGKGEYDKAIAYYEKALKIRLAGLGDAHPDVAQSYNNLGRAWDNKGAYDKAIACFEKSLEIRVKALGEEHPAVGQSYNNLGSAWDGKGKYDKAIVYYEKALKIGLKKLGDEHPSIATWYNNLAVAWYNRGEYDKATFYLAKALENLENAQDRTGYLAGLGNFSDLLAKANKPKVASENYARLTRLVLKYRFELSGEKSSFTARYIRYFNDAIAFELSQNNPAKAFEYDALRRGLSLAEALSLKDALAQGGVTTSEEKQMLDLASEIEALRAQQAASLNHGKKDKADELLQQIFAKEKTKDELDQKLAKNYPKYREIRFPKAPSVESIQKSLGEDEIFVSYLLNVEKPVAFVVEKKAGLWVVPLISSTPSPSGRGGWGVRLANFHTLHTGNTDANIVPITGKDGIVYWNSGAQQGKYDIDKDGKIVALVQRRERGMQTEMGQKAQLEKIEIGKAGEALTPAQIKAEREKLRAELYNTFIAPIQKEYPTAKNWAVSPDGALYYLPFPLLAGPKVKIPNITLAHSAVVWQKLRGGERKPTGRTLLAFGNAVYGSGHSDTRRAKAGQQRSATTASAARLGQMRANGSTNTSELEWDNLSGTGEEVNQIAALAYRDAKGKDGNIYTGIAANVDRVFSLKEQKLLSEYKYIHFAVHGLFVDGNPALNALVMTLPEKAKVHKTDEYNAYIKKQPLKADGYLRAGDISALNLNAELVVMSACETSLGHEVGGEGMVALPQSFLTAGARAVVASLWSVDDAATSAFMQRFYRHLLTDKQKPKLALANTQREFREDAALARFRDPFYWAAFVIYGE